MPDQPPIGPTLRDDDAHPPDHDPRVVQIPDHELLRCIDGGSYGEVWLARSVTHTYRAVKVVRARNFKSARPFEREFAGILEYEPISRSHNNLVDILHVGRDSQAGHLYYVMELADDKFTGQHIVPAEYVPRTLRAEVEKRGKLPVGECLFIGLSLTAGLQYLHERGLVHRDIKLGNIIFIQDVPKLADIGLVTKADEGSTFVGTEGYIPPEGPGSPQADVYALGKVLYEILTGKDRLQFPELPTALVRDPERDRALQLNAIILRACAPDPRDRYATAAELNADLVLLSGGGSVLARLAARRQRAFLRKYVLPAAAVLASVLLAGLIVSGTLGLRTETLIPNPPAAVAAGQPPPPATPPVALVTAATLSARAQSCANLRQIMLAMMLYANSAGDRYPDGLEPLLAQGYLDNPAVLVSPLDTAALPVGYYTWPTERRRDWATAHCSYVFLRFGQRMQQSPTLVTGFEQFAPHKNGTVVGFDDGRVMWLPESEARHLVQSPTSLPAGSPAPTPPPAEQAGEPTRDR